MDAAHLRRQAGSGQGFAGRTHAFQDETCRVRLKARATLASSDSPGDAADWMLLSKAIMQTAQHPFPVHVRTGWIDFSPMLHWYATHQVRSALRPVASRVRAVTVRIADHAPHDPSTRLCAIDVTLKPVGTTSATAVGRNVCELVDRAIEASLDKLREPPTILAA